MNKPQGEGIFVSYRRHQNSHVAGRLYDRLVDHFGADRVFIDVDTIEPGVDFGEAIARAVETCGVLLTVIGPNWLTAMDDQGRPRLEASDDLVRIEIKTALDRNVRIIPILVENAVMPSQQDLPENLAGLARRNAFTVRHESFRYDVDRLVASIEDTMGSRRREAPETKGRIKSREGGQAIQRKEWALDYVTRRGVNTVLRLSSSTEKHEIIITIPQNIFRDDKIEVDGELIAKWSHIEGEIIPLRTLTSIIGSHAAIEVECTSVHYLKSVTITVGDQVLVCEFNT
jgi:hypothetical protein